MGTGKPLIARTSMEYRIQVPWSIPDEHSAKSSEWIRGSLVTLSSLAFIFGPERIASQSNNIRWLQRMVPGLMSGHWHSIDMVVRIIEWCESWLLIRRRPYAGFLSHVDATVRRPVIEELMNAIDTGGRAILWKTTLIVAYLSMEHIGQNMNLWQGFHDIPFRKSC